MMITAILLIIVYLFGLFLLLTPKGYELRTIAAEVVLSSQHRDLAKFTLLPKDDLDDILEKIENPAYINSTEGEVFEELKQNIGKRSFVNIQTFLSKNDSFQIDNTEELTKPLIIKLKDIEGTFIDHYYKGKLLMVSNPLNVRLATSKGEQINENFGEQINVIADREGAIAAINAGGFVDANGTGNGGTPIGIVFSDGKVIAKGNGMNAKTYISGITKEGLFVTGYFSPNDLLEMNVQHAAGFKPQLIVNGEKMITDGNGGWGYGPRTAVGQTKDGTILLLVIDGRQAHSIGASQKDVQDILYEHGAINAMAMDGGSSSSMYFNKEHITTPSSVGNIPRYLPNAWVVVPDEGQKVEVYVNDKKIEINH